MFVFQGHLSEPVIFSVFTGLHSMQCGLGCRKSVRLSVCKTRELWKKTSAHILIPYERLIHLVLRRTE